MNTTHESRATVLVPTLRQHNAMQADTASRYARATNTTACVEQQWSDRDQNAWITDKVIARYRRLSSKRAARAAEPKGFRIVRGVIVTTAIGAWCVLVVLYALPLLAKVWEWTP